MRPKSLTTLILPLGVPAAGVLAFGIGVGLGVRGNDVGILGLAILSAVVALVLFALDSRREPRDRHILLSFFCLSWIFFFVVPVFASHFMGTKRVGDVGMFTSNVASRDILNGQKVAFAGLVAFLAGYAFPLRRLLYRERARVRYDWTPNTTLVVALLMLSAGWLTFLLSQAGLVPKALGTGVMGTIASFSKYSLALLTVAYIHHRSRTALLLLLLFVPPSMAFNFLTASKGFFFAPLALPVLAYMVAKRRIDLRWVALFSVLVLVLFPVLQFYRVVVVESFRHSAIDILRNPGAAIAQMSRFPSQYQNIGGYMAEGFQQTARRFDGLGVVSVIVRDTPRVIPYQGGWSLAHIPIGFVPRVLWPGKPTLGIGRWVTDNYGPGPHVESHTGPTWIGEFYFNFGYWGVVAGMWVMGFLFRVAHEALVRPEASVPTLLAVVFLVWAPIRGLETNLISAINPPVLFLVPLFLLHLFVRSPSAPRRWDPELPRRKPMEARITP